MRIGIDARVLQTGLKNRGIGTYAYNLIRELLKLKTKHQLVFYLFKNHEIPEILKGQEIIKLYQHRSLNFLYQQFNTFKGNIDIFHTPVCIGPSREIIMPYLQPKKAIGTVHDLTFYHLPDGWSRCLSHTRDYRLQLLALRKAKKIIAISSYGGTDLQTTLGIPSEKIAVIYYGGAAPIFKPLEKCRGEEPERSSSPLPIRKKYGIREKFILGVGDEYDYKKNISTLFKVISSFHEVQLVIAGNSNKNSKLKTQNSKNIIFTGEVSQEELRILYNLAEVLVFPSFAEGFGLPPLEAMACGCPVIASNRWSLPEVVGNGGVLVEPRDVKGIVRTIKKIIDDSSFKEELILMGFEQVKKFSWEKCARETLEVYEDVLYG